MGAIFFTAILFLSPIPVCTFLVRYLGANSDSLSGTILGSLKVQIAGVVAVYVLVLGLTFVSVAPETLGLNLPHAPELWDFKLNPPYEAKSPPSIRGTLFLRSRGGDVSDLSGTAEEGKTFGALRPGGVRLKSPQYLFLLLRLPYQTKDLMAFGSTGSEKSVLPMQVASLETDLNTVTREKPGSLTLSRLWPWSRWFLVTVLPLVVIFILSKIGPLMIRISGEIGALPDPISQWIEGVTVKIGGATAAYFLVVMAVLFFEVGFPQTLDSANKLSVETCRNVNGRWYFNLFHQYSDSRNVIPDYTGSFDVSCTSTDFRVRMSGFANVMFEPRYRYSDKTSCYERIQPGKGNFQWHSVAAAIVDDTITTIYQGDDGEELGVLRGPVSSGAQQKWIFADFRNFARRNTQVNRGEIIVFREGVSRTQSCADLSRRRLAARSR